MTKRSRSAALAWLALSLAACTSSSPGNLVTAAQTNTRVTQCTGDLANLTYTGFARPFFQTYCAGCHSPGGPVAPADWTNYGAVLGSLDAIDALAGANPDGSVVHTVMPPSAGPSFASIVVHPPVSERVKLSCWIATGANY